MDSPKPRVSGTLELGEEALLGPAGLPGSALPEDITEEGPPNPLSAKLSSEEAAWFSSDSSDSCLPGCKGFSGVGGCGSTQLL